MLNGCIEKYKFCGTWRQSSVLLLFPGFLSFWDPNTTGLLHAAIVNKVYFGLLRHKGMLVGQQGWPLLHLCLLVSVLLLCLHHPHCSTPIGCSLFTHSHKADIYLLTPHRSTVPALESATLQSKAAREDERVKYGNESQKYSSNQTKLFGDKLF